MLFCEHHGDLRNQSICKKVNMKCYWLKRN